MHSDALGCIRIHLDAFGCVRTLSENFENFDEKIDFSACLSGFKETRKMDHVRKVIAKHMVNSLKTSPHVYSSVEVDMTDIVASVRSNKDIFLEILQMDIGFLFHQQQF